MYVRPHARGLGATPQQINSIVTTGASTTLGILAGLHAVIGGIALAGPVGAAIAGLIAVGSLVANMFHGCGQTCVIASQDADKFGNLAQQNLKTYMNSPVHYASLQAAALNNFDTLMAALQQGCSDPSLGAAGQRCISERLVKGGTAPWCPNPGHTGCDWITTMRDPIANDPNVVPDPSPIAQAGSSVLSSVGLSPSTQVFGMSLADLALPAAIIGLALFLPSGKR